MTEQATDAGRGRPRRRGRPRAGGDARGRIVHAAEREFAERGYEAVSLRGIARRAEVDPALVHHYFDDKAALFTEVIAVPMRPDKALARITAGPREAIGAEIARYVLTEWDRPEMQRRGIALIRSVVASDLTGTIVRGFLTREIFHRIAGALDSPDAELRANLAASQLVGVMITRYVLRLEPIASAHVEDVIARVGPALQWHLVGYEPPLDGSPSAGE